MKNRVLVLVAALSFACSPFRGETNGDLTAGDGGAAGGSDAGGAVGGGNGAIDRSGATYAMPGSGFCASHATAIFCDDFDHAADPGWTNIQVGDGASLKLVPGLTTPPNALLASAPQGSLSLISTPKFPLAGRANTTVVAELDFALSGGPTGVYVANMGFENTATPIGLDGDGKLACAGGSSTTVLTPGTHHIEVNVHVGAAGSATSVDCVLDGVAVGASLPLQAGAKSFVMIFGPRSTATESLILDDVIVYAK